MTVDHERRDRISIITIRREDKRNAVNSEVTEGLDAALNAFEDDPDQWIAILTGGPSVFSAGTDLSEGPGPPTERGGEYGLIRRHRRKPLIAAVEGVAFGGGFEIAMAADLVVAASDARFALPEVKRGVVANSGALFRTTKALPVNLAKELLLTGREISAEHAHRLGFVNRVSEPGRVLDSALELAEEIAANAPIAVSETLQALDSIVSADDEAGWKATDKAFEAVLTSEDIREGVDAFFERRQPRWQGR